MSKRRSIIVAVTVEGVTQAEAARRYGVTKGWVSKLIARWRAEGEAAFEPRSRRPHSSPTRIDPPVVELIVELRRTLTEAGLDAGPVTIAWHLEQDHQLVVSVSTIRRYLVAAGLVTPQPRKRPKSSFIRFQAELPNEMWQTDMTHVRLATGSDVEVLSWLDDHSRYALAVTAHRRVSTNAVVTQFCQTAAQHGYPASVLSDNGMYFTTRYAGGKGGTNRFETLLADLGVIQKHSRPNHPRTCGKVERFQQTLKKWLTARSPATTIATLQDLLDGFVDHYNHHRPHRALGRATPAVAYRRLPKAQPNTNTDPDSQPRVRHDHIDTCGKVTVRYNGRLHHIGVGRRYAYTRVVMLIDHLDIRIINHTTGELIRHLQLDPTRDYQPQNTRNP